MSITKEETMQTPAIKPIPLHFGAKIPQVPFFITKLLFKQLNGPLLGL
jgi:hypothetical protein